MVSSASSIPSQVFEIKSASFSISYEFSEVEGCDQCSLVKIERLLAFILVLNLRVNVYIINLIMEKNETKILKISKVMSYTILASKISPFIRTKS